MFTADPNITELNIRERVIFKALFSMNIHQVATPELSTEDARCYFFLFRDNGRFSAYAALYLPRTDRRFFYSYSQNPFFDESVAEALDEARKFAEDMGFLMDEINISAMSPEEKNRWIDEQGIFAVKKKAEPKPAAQAPQAAQIPVESAAEPVEAAITADTAQSSPVVEAKTAADEEPEAQKPALPQKKTARPSRTAPASAAPERRDDVISEAVKAGVVKPPKQSLKKEMQSASGAVSRDKEALARLLASF